MIKGAKPLVDPFLAGAALSMHQNLPVEPELDFEADLRAQDAWRESQLMQETGGLGSMAKGVMRPGGRHTVVCKHWLRDLCMKGDKCDFLHQYDLARMPECLQWSRFGKCGDQECDFRHDTERMECQKYKFGFCKLGSQCKMRHDKHSRAYLPEIMPDWFLKELMPNIFDFVPRLPEEAVRVTQTEEPMMPMIPQQQWAPPVMPDAGWAAPAWGAANAWAPAEAAWAAPAVVDLTEDKRKRDERRDDTRRGHKRDYEPPREKREVPERQSRREEPPRASRSTEKVVSRPDRDDRRRDEEYKKPSRHHSPPRREPERSSRQQSEVRKPEKPKEEWWEKQASRRRSRSRSNERRRDDRRRDTRR